MIFKIERTSDIVNSSTKPCEEAFKKEFTEIVEWSGAEHKYEDWVVEINTLEELLVFIDKYGPLVIDWDYNIEIYDDYRE